MRIRQFAATLALGLTLSGLTRASEPTTASALTEPVSGVPGALVIVGGGGLPDTIRECFLNLAGGPKARLVVIPTASIKADNPDQLKSFGYWKAQDVSSVLLLHTRRRELANDPAFSRALHQATGVWMSGGDQTNLVKAYRGTTVERELHDLLQRGGVIGGTSAGAAVMSSVMITGGNPLPQVDSGFGLLPGVVVDQHLTRRNRIPRLLSALTTHPGYFGLGIEEQAGVVVQGKTMTVIGDADVRICFPPCGKDGADVQTFHPGAKVDLVEYSQRAVARARAALSKEKTEPMHAMK
jgi:cyanophycinase